MRKRIINYLKRHPIILDLFWKSSSLLLKLWGIFLPIDEKCIIFTSFGGRNFDDSPRAIYEEICNRPEFDDWRIIWAFVHPDQFQLVRGETVKIDTLSFFKSLLTSKVWVSNSGMSRGIKIKREKIIKIETWHGTPLKKIGGEEHQNSMLKNKKNNTRLKLDSKTIRCAQSEFDSEIFQRIFNASKKSILMTDLPRNDALLRYDTNKVDNIRKKLGIAKNKKVILYTPTYREYLVDKGNNTYIAPPIDFNKWNKMLSSEYVVLFRAHYAVNQALNLKSTKFVLDVSDYPNLNDLYIISDMMISDYSSTFVDYSILERPMLCFAYDLDEYQEKRGLYVNLEEILPCPVDKDEDSIINRIISMDYEKSCLETLKFKKRYAPFAGSASKKVVDEIIKNINTKATMEKKKRIGIIGHFGGNEDFTDGQTVKVKSLYKAFLSYPLKMHVDTVDTYYLKRKPFKVILSFIKCIFMDKKIVFLPATNGRKVLFPVMYHISKILNKDIYHDCIGGALVNELNSHPNWIKYLNEFKTNWMESEIQSNQLRNFGIKNSSFLPNFKNILPLVEDEIEKISYSLPYRFCTFSRILPQKGILDAVDAIKKVNDLCGEQVATLDIYGPIQKGCEEWFDELLSQNSDICTYCGVVEPDMSISAIKNYFALLFPTQYYTEGMPGTIIDAMFAGIPVIARRWAYCDQMIINGHNGFSYDFNSPEKLETIILEVIKKPEKIVLMKKNCLKEAYKYAEVTVIERIINEMNLNE